MSSQARVSRIQQIEKDILRLGAHLQVAWFFFIGSHELKPVGSFSFGGIFQGLE